METRSKKKNKIEHVRCENCDRDIELIDADCIEQKYYCKKCVKDLSKNPEIKKKEKKIKSINQKVIDYIKSKISEVKNIQLKLYFPFLIIILCIYMFKTTENYNLIFVNIKETYNLIFFKTTGNDFNCSEENALKQSIKKYLSAEFPSQNKDTWISLMAGLSSAFIIKPGTPTSFFLIHEYNDETANCLAKRFSELVTNCYNPKISNYTEVSSTELANNRITDSLLLDLYRQKVETNKVMLVKNLNNIPGRIVQSFHIFCDQYEVLIDKAIYIFTMGTAKDTIKNDNNIRNTIQHLFAQTWLVTKAIHPDKIDALRTRMTDNVIAVKSEERFRLNGC